MIEDRTQISTLAEVKLKWLTLTDTNQLVNQHALQMASKHRPSPETTTFCYHEPGQKVWWSMKLKLLRNLEGIREVIHKTKGNL